MKARTKVRLRIFDYETFGESPNEWQWFVYTLRAWAVESQRLYKTKQGAYKGAHRWLAKYMPGVEIEEDSP